MLISLNIFKINKLLIELNRIINLKKILNLIY